MGLLFVLLNKIPLKLCWEKKRKYPHTSPLTPGPDSYLEGECRFPKVESWFGAAFLGDPKEKVKREGQSHNRKI